MRLETRFAPSQTTCPTFGSRERVLSERVEENLALVVGDHELSRRRRAVEPMAA